MYRTILCPYDEDGFYDTDLQFEMEDLYNAYKTMGYTEFALLDALSLEFYGKIELQ